MTKSSKTPHTVLAHALEVGDTVTLDGVTARVEAIHPRSGGYLSLDLSGGIEAYVLRYRTVTILL